MVAPVHFILFLLSSCVERSHLAVIESRIFQGFVLNDFTGNHSSKMDVEPVYIVYLLPVYFNMYYRLRYSYYFLIKKKYGGTSAR